ncbi:dTDP-4-dehydrorhamnose reductase [uncultured Aquimarina sp.]|uniref:dTDP-4-dehydrorhamnose reductase n=1 Tax=uncultured Aquimarina sp. TaxID=575652 RepID=UPI002603CB90|nr:dTDP-4-dehydrorhamnose reductase [uncultured Aquimarina sp.]
MKNILVTGGKGQLASCIKDVENFLNDFNFIYVDYDELDITKENDVKLFFEKQEIKYCINCAAYTAVDKAESEAEISKEINTTGARFLAESCKKHNAVFIQISTDFVFDGKQSFPYTETDKTTPLGIYGITKLGGEKATISSVDKYFIIRTSWLYSEYGNNFLKTMLRLGKEREELSVVCDQVGTPTYAGDLADMILKIITEESSYYGTYHYSNEGVASWYDFAKTIFDESEIKIKLLPIKTEAYPTPAQRPYYSVMDKSKIKETFNIEIPYWRDSLKKTITAIKNGKD